MVEVRAQLRNLRMSPKKVRLVAAAVSGLDISSALNRLRYLNTAPAPVIAKLLRSAVANAKHNGGLAEDGLFIKSILVDEGVALKRFRPAAMGAAHPFKRRASHISVVLSVRAGTPAVPARTSPSHDKDKKEKKVTEKVWDKK